MNKAQVIKHFGTVKKAAAALNITHQAIYAWGDVLPDKTQRMIELETKGKLKADRKKGRDER